MPKWAVRARRVERPVPRAAPTDKNVKDRASIATANRFVKFPAEKDSGFIGTI